MLTFGQTAKSNGPTSSSLEGHAERTSDSLGNGPVAMASMMQMMPLPGIVGAPVFNGYNVSESLKVFEDLCDDFGLNAAQKVAHVERYCVFTVKRVVRGMPAFTKKEWPELKTAMLKKWENTMKNRG